MNLVNKVYAFYVIVVLNDMSSRYTKFTIDERPNEVFRKNKN